MTANMALKGRHRLLMVAILLHVACLIPLITAKAVAKSETDSDGMNDKPIGGQKAFSEHGNRLRRDTVVWNSTTGPNAVCDLKALNPSLISKIKAFEGSGGKLLQYDVSFSGYETNPLLEDMGEHFKANQWTKALSKTGKVLLTLPFNYKLLSLTMLSFGVDNFQVDLMDSPSGCFGNLTTDEKMMKMAETVLLDFGGRTSDDAGIGCACHQRIYNDKGVAGFKYQCCQQLDDGQLMCVEDIPARWITIMSFLIKLIKVIVFLIGPTYLISWTYTESVYIVNLKRPIIKSLLVLKDLWLSFKVFSERGASLEDSPKFAYAVKKFAPGKINSVSFRKLHIRVSHRQLVSQRSVPVGLFRFIVGNVIWCGMRRWEPFNSCCKKSVLGTWGPKFLWVKLCRKAEYINHCSWERVLNILGGVALVVAIPFPYYLRLAVYYTFEEPVVMARKEAVRDLGLSYPLEHSLIHYIDPRHPFMLLVYVAYVLSFVVCVILRGYYGSSFDNISMGAVKDMSQVQKLESLRLILSHFILPLEKFGICGVIVGMVYWPIVLPFCLLTIICYCIPMVYLLGRFFIQTRPRCLKHLPIPTAAKDGQTLSEEATSFENCMLLSNISPQDRPRIGADHHMCLSIVIGVLCSLLIVSVFLLLAEVLGFCVEVFIYTLIGAIVNSSVAATYLMLAFWIIVYGTACFNNVYNRYMELNLKIFESLKANLEEEITDVTNVREEVQENTAFKFYDHDQLDQLRTKEIQKEMELSTNPGVSDDLKEAFIEDRLECIQDKLYWRINSLAMFVDHHDIPHIPETLFHEICNLETPGCPGPVHLSMIEAFKQLSYMVIFLVFVLITVVTFGDGLATGNQMLVALAGGFLPFVIRFVMAPKKADIDVDSLAFKAKFHQIKLRFNELWPVEDLFFKVEDSEKVELDDIELEQLKTHPGYLHSPDEPSSNWLTRQLHRALSRVEDQFENGQPYHYPSARRSPSPYCSSQRWAPPKVRALNLLSVDLENKRIQVTNETFQEDGEGLEGVEETDRLMGSKETSVHFRAPGTEETPL